MKKSIIVTIAIVISALCANAQENMYIMKNGKVVSIYNTDSQIDSVIFYKPAGVTTDINGNVYDTVVIGTQVWMKENLKTTKYNDGTPIPLVTDNAAWGALTSPGYCWYNNDEFIYKNTYGALYNWHAVNTGKLCPSGWHVATDADWNTLTTYLGGQDVAGGKLKATGTTHWENDNVGATNETGFTALPGGNRRTNGTFYWIGKDGYWWSPSNVPGSERYIRLLQGNSERISRSDFTEPQQGYSVRCVRD